LQSRIYESSRVAGATFLLDFHIAQFRRAHRWRPAELAVVTVASLANAVFLMGQQIGLISNGRDAADRIREEGWRADFLTRNDARARAAEPQKPTPACAPSSWKPPKGEDQLMAEILAALARLEHTDGLDFADMMAKPPPEFRATPPSSPCWAP
jgi:hypothetical protein